MTEEEKEALKELKSTQDAKAVGTMLAIGIVALLWLIAKVFA